MRALLVSILLLATAMPAVAEAPAGDTVVASGGSLTLSYSEAVAELERLRGENPRVSAPSVAEIRGVLAGLLRDEAMAAEASAEGLDKQPGVAEALERARRGVLKQALLKEKVGSLDNKTLEALARDYYDTRREQFRVRPEIEVSHILFAMQCENVDPTCPEKRAAKEVQAKETLAKLLTGADFAELAKELSEDPNSAKLGGKIPFGVTRQQIDPRFWKAAWELEPGQLSGVVETRYGYHIIRLDSKTQEGIPSFSEVKRLLMKTLNEDQLRARAAEIESGYYQKAMDTEWDLKALEALVVQFTPTKEGARN